VLDEATAAIRKQIAELEQLLEREVTRAAQEATSVEAGLRAARESAARESPPHGRRDRAPARNPEHFQGA
jgi:prefoldin subunit 5